MQAVGKKEQIGLPEASLVDTTLCHTDSGDHYLYICLIPQPPADIDKCEAIYD